MQPLSIKRDVRRNGIRMGFTVVPFGQGFKDMSPPTKEFYKLLMDRKGVLPTAETRSWRWTAASAMRSRAVCTMNEGCLSSDGNVIRYV